MTHTANPPVDERTPRRTGTVLLYFGMLAPPLAWSLQENIGFGFSSHACFPRTVPLTHFHQNHADTWVIVLSVNVVLLLVSVAGIVTSWLAWRRTRSVSEARSDAHSNLEAPGEDRIRVFAASGLLVSMLFVVAIAVNTISLLLLSTCSQA